MEEYRVEERQCVEETEARRAHDKWSSQPSIYAKLAALTRRTHSKLDRWSYK
jgi:hypothetical protein